MKRPTLTLPKKPRPLAQATPPPPPPPPPTAQTPNPPKQKSAKNKQMKEKEKRRLENIRLASEASARNREQFAKARPIIKTYLSSKLIFQETVFIDDVECFRPLMIGIHKQVFNLFRADPELADCTNTVISKIINVFIIRHIKKPQYIAGMLKFDNRFDFDINPVEVISDEHKTRAVEMMQNLNTQAAQTAQAHPQVM